MGRPRGPGIDGGDLKATKRSLRAYCLRAFESAFGREWDADRDAYLVLDVDAKRGVDALRAQLQEKPDDFLSHVLRSIERRPEESPRTATSSRMRPNEAV